MKPKEYLKKYNLSNGWSTSYQKDFLNDLSNELLVFIEYYNAFDKPVQFNNAVNVIRDKWNAISNKVPFGLPDELWNYFYASIISKFRRETLPTETARKERERKEFIEAKKEEKIRQKIFDERYRAEYEERRNRWFKMMLGCIVLASAPIESFNILQLSPNSTVEEINASYRKLILNVHPDRGGNQEEFCKITEARNKCLAWAK